MDRRPKSLQNLAFYKELPDPWKEYLADTSERKKAIRLLAQMLKQEEDLSTATEVLTQTLQKGCHDLDSILTTWYRLTGQIPEPAEVSVPSELNQKVVFEVNLDVRRHFTMKQMIEAYCKELKLGSHIAEYYSTIEAKYP